MAGFRLTALAALVCFCLLTVSRFAGAQTPIFSLVSTPVPVPATTSVPESTTTAMPTPSPTTSPSLTSTTSSSSSTSPPPSPISTPVTPIAAAGSYFFYNKTSNTICVLVTGNIQLDVSYENSTSGKVVSEQLKVTGDLNGTVDDSKSFCTSTHANLTLWFHGDDLYNHILTFAFEKTKNDYDLKITTQLNLTDSTLFPEYNTSNAVEVTGVTDSIFSTSMGRSYECGSSNSYKMTTTKNTVKSLSVTISNFQAQAFKTDESGVFDKATSCTKDQKTSKVVPIAVGAALAGLVVVVLIAYLIGRFRSRKQNSYEALS